MTPSSKENIWIVIAAFNEERMIDSVIQDVLNHLKNVVVVDDASTDRSAAIAKQSGAFVITHPINLGQGAALQTGIDFALSQGAKIIATFDADGQHNIEDVLRMIKRLENEDLDVVLGSRFLGEAINIPQLRRITLKMAAIFTRLSSGVAVSDAHNGLRVFSAAALSKIRIRQNRMAHASEIIDAIGQKKLKYSEEPVSIVYTQYSLEKGQKISNSLTILIDLLMNRFGKGK